MMIFESLGVKTHAMNQSLERPFSTDQSCGHCGPIPNEMVAVLHQHGQSVLRNHHWNLLETAETFKSTYVKVKKDARLHLKCEDFSNVSPVSDQHWSTPTELSLFDWCVETIWSQLFLHVLCMWGWHVSSISSILTWPPVQPSDADGPRSLSKDFSLQNMSKKKASGAARFSKAGYLWNPVLKSLGGFYTGARKARMTKVWSVWCLKFNHLAYSLAFQLVRRSFPMYYVELFWDILSIHVVIEVYRDFLYPSQPHVCCCLWTPNPGCCTAVQASGSRRAMERGNGLRISGMALKPDSCCMLLPTWFLYC